MKHKGPMASILLGSWLIAWSLIGVSASTIAASGNAGSKPLSCVDMMQVRINRVTIASATIIAATATGPERCDVRGSIAPKADGLPINFRVLLPKEWNGESIQGGGGGFDGYVAVGQAPMWSTPASAAAFEFRGYALYGSDSGHVGGMVGSDQAWALRSEALINYGYASLKQTKDVATRLIALRYGKPPSKNYFIGFSTGGREALEVAQRFPADYDGVISGDPVQNLTLQFFSHMQATRPYTGPGYLSPTKQLLLGKFVLKACDGIDGLVDGRIGASLQCKPDIRPLRCPDGSDTGDTCLSDVQIAAVYASRSPIKLPYPMANGVTSIAGKPWGGELIDNGATYRLAYIPEKGSDDAALTALLYDPFIRYFVARDANYVARSFDWMNNKYLERTQRISAIIDSSSANLAAFRRRGGKLILYAGGASEVPPEETAAYYNRLVATMGKKAVDSFVRFYMFPNATHAGLTLPGTPRAANLMEAFENWTEHGVAPGNLINSSPTVTTRTATWPLCRYPAYPRYLRGDPMQLASYRCAMP